MDINTSDGSGEWYKNPTIIGGGVFLLVLVAVLVGRGSGTTIVKS